LGENMRAASARRLPAPDSADLAQLAQFSVRPPDISSEIRPNIQLLTSRHKEDRAPSGVDLLDETKEFGDAIGATDGD
jgi:hypothetical protein